MARPADLPGLPPAEHARRRRQVLERIEGGVMILPAGRPPAYSRDVEHRHRPDSDFLWVTGYPEPEAIAVLRPDADNPYTLFVLPRDPAKETWTGRRLGPEGARERFGADAAFPLADFARMLPDLLDGAERLWYAPWRYPDLDRRVREALETLRGRERFGRRAPGILADPGLLLHELRLVKSPAELELLAEACRVSAAGHLAGIARCRPGVTERQVQAAIEQVFLDRGAVGPGYPTIVGAGANGCILHYVENSATIGEDDLVLVDAGAELGGYNGDITRTFPAGGRFLPAQRALYELVLAAEEEAIAATRPGATIDGIHEGVLRTLSRGLVELGLLEGPWEQVLEEKRYERYFMHRTSHWLGMDVHDVGNYREDGVSRPLVPGMVLTIEPGLYVPPDDESVPPEYRGQAVRIEDDVVVTGEGCRVLTRDVPVDPDELAGLVGRG